MIHNIAPHHYDITYRTAPPKASDTILAYQNGRLLCKIKGENIIFPTVEEISGSFMPIFIKLLKKKN